MTRRAERSSHQQKLRLEVSPSARQCAAYSPGEDVPKADADRIHTEFHSRADSIRANRRVLEGPFMSRGFARTTRSLPFGNICRLQRSSRLNSYADVMTTIKTLMVVLLALAWAPVVSILVLLSYLDRQLREWPAADPPEGLQREASEWPSIAGFARSLPRGNESPAEVVACRATNPLDRSSV